jgi:transcriptional regulator with XRE-family HTH domain
VSGHRLDVPELYRLLDAQRQARGMSWRDVAEACGLSPSTPTRISKGRAPDAHGLVSLIVWLDLDTDICRLVQPREEP